MRYLLVANPTAQSGKNAARIAAARELLDGAGLRHDFLATLPAGATVEAVRAALAGGGYDVAIYMGGDGTFAEVAKGILASGRPVALGMLPTGTANDQGKSFGLDADELQLPVNVRVLVENVRAKLDVGRIVVGDLTEHFFDSAGWGLSPRVLHERNEDREAVAQIPLLGELYRDKLVYAGALLRTFLAGYVDDDKFDARVVADGHVVEWSGLTDLVVKATKVYGGLWVLDADALPDDGLFEVVPFVGRRDWISKALVALDASGAMEKGLAAIGVRHSDSIQAAHIELTLTSHEIPVRAQIDGEEIPHAETVTIDVLPRALEIIVPAR
jgi:diacylglycerol kinase family enzyme